MTTFWENRLVLITGAGGFLGAHLAARLLAEGARIVCLQRSAGQINSLDLLKIRENVEIFCGSIENDDDLDKLFSRYEFDAVFHLAAQSLVGAAHQSPISTFESNIRGTYLLLDACRRCASIKRVVVASSVTAYGSRSKLPYLESDGLTASSPYNTSKACADLIAQTFAQSYQLPLTIARPANVYGAGDRHLSRIIPGTIASVIQNQNPVIRSDGSPIREFIFVGDVVRGLLKMAEAIECTQGRSYNLGSNQTLKIIDVVKKILRLSGKDQTLSPEILVQNHDGRKPDAEYLSSQKIQDELGWRAETDLDSGLKQTIEWYQRNLDVILKTAG